MKTQIESKHTKGPWIHETSQTGTEHVCAGEEGIATVCMMFASDFIEPDERKANARLIALAPEMFDALVAFEQCEDETKLRERVRAIISKLTCK